MSAAGNIGERFAAVMEQVHRVLARCPVADRVASAIVLLLWNRLRRRTRRVLALYAAFKAGTLKPLPPPRPRTRKPPVAPKFRPGPAWPDRPPPALRLGRRGFSPA